MGTHFGLSPGNYPGNQDRSFILRADRRDGEKRAVLTLDGARLSRDGELRAATDVGVRFCVLKSTYTSP
jgi:hypothetical protein